MADQIEQPKPRGRARLGISSLLAGMRIRQKLIVLHTCFSLVLAAMLGVALRPAVKQIVERAEQRSAENILLVALSGAQLDPEVLPHQEIDLRSGDPVAAGLSPAEAARLRDQPGRIITLGTESGAAMGPRVGAYIPESDRYISAGVRLLAAREAVVRLYLLMMFALLAVYALVAIFLEVLVLPETVWRPIRRLLAADRAVQEGRREDELIPEPAMPADEIGEIMRSRNDTIAALRRHQRELARALAQLEEVAVDLKRKNHLLEMARRNLADADRLASLGIMSAGLAHELNTPLAVLKGLAEKVAAGASIHPRARSGNGKSAEAGGGISAAEAELMLRVVGRLEKLAESLLDFARVRPPTMTPTELRTLADEAWTLVALDRHAARISFINHVRADMLVECDADRIMQVLVNLLRNAVDALDAPGGPGAATTAPAAPPRIEVAATTARRDGRDWVSLTIADNGPGIDPEVLSRMFEPFVSTRLDAQGTGLGLAVSEGIVKEHGGLLMARNRKDARGAVFEMLLPARGLRTDSGASGAPIRATAVTNLEQPATG